MIKKTKELRKFEKAANHLLAMKVLGDYITSVSVKPTEPEHFVEEWISVHLTKPTVTLKKNLWKTFLNEWQIYLINRRKFGGR